MRIESYAQVQQLYNANKIKKSNQENTVKRADQFEISKVGKELQIVKNAIASTPDVRKELVDPIKSRIQNGTYEVSNESFAEKLIQKYDESKMS